jgi:hypothetical protein
MGEILYVLFWMLVGAAATHLYHNANFKKALAEELEEAKSSVNKARANVKDRL